LCGGDLYRFDHRSRRVAMEICASPSRDFRAEARPDRAGSPANFARRFSIFLGAELTYDNYLDYCSVEGVEPATSPLRIGTMSFVAPISANFEWASILGGFAGFPVLDRGAGIQESGVDAVFDRVRSVPVIASRRARSHVEDAACGEDGEG